MSMLDDGQPSDFNPTGADGQPPVGAPAGSEALPPAQPGALNVSIDSKMGDILTDDLLNDKTMERFKDRSLGEYIQDTLEMRRTMGGMVKVPPSDADFDTKQEYLYGVMDKLGFEKPPATSGEYQFDMTSLPPGQEADPNLTEWARSAFHEARLTNAQANMIIKKWNEQAGQALEKSFAAEKNAYDNTAALLKKEWGESFEANRRAVVATAQKIFPATLIKKLEDAQLGNDPEFLRAVLDIKKKYMSEHDINPGLGTDNPVDGGLTTREKMLKILSDPNWKTDVSLQKEYARLAEISAATHKKVVR